jgi:2-polyprenyl-3-methyl-5-hydroxy-6-metoxy-1,4-benzoquinol methylase
MKSNPYQYTAKTRYDEQKVKKYQQRKPARHRAEMRIVARAFTSIPKWHRILDVPCGWGRITATLAKEGYQVTGADISTAMLAAARETLDTAQLRCPIEYQDIERMAYPDRCFDTVICFRLFHHFPSVALRRHVVGELCRVADGFVLLSYLSPFSITSIRRQIRSTLLHTELTTHSTSIKELRGYFLEAGFHLVRDFPQTPYFHSLHLALFQRSESLASDSSQR